MVKKIIGFIIGIILLSGIAYAVDTGDVISYWKSDTNGAYPDEKLINNGSIAGSTYNATGFINACYTHDGNNDRETITDHASLRFTEASNFSINCWVRGTYDGGITEIVVKRATNDRYQIMLDASNKLQTEVSDGSNIQRITDSVAINPALWIMVTLTYTGTNETSCFYKNNTLVGCDATNLAGLSTTGADMYIGGGSNGYFKGNIDECAVFNKPLTSADRAQLYNSHAGLQYPFPSYFQITAKSWTNLTSITNFSATVNGTAFSTTNGTIITTYTNSSGTLNISIVNATGHQDRDYNNYNTSTNLEAILYRIGNEYLKIYAYGGGTLLSNILFNLTSESKTSANNPYTENIYNYLNYSTTTYNITLKITPTSSVFQDYTGTITINNTNYQNYTINLTPKQLYLQFKLENGSNANVSGYLSDMNHTEGFIDVEYLENQNELTTGYVKVYFHGYNQTFQNYTQFYEYINDQTTNEHRNITIIENATQQFWIKIMDTSNRPIKDALIRISTSRPNALTHANYTFTGQRLTNQDGKAFFYVDPKTNLLIEVIKDGYSYTTNMTNNMEEITTSESSPYNVFLQRGTENLDRGIFLDLARIFTDRTANIYGGLLAIGRTSAKYYTAYMATTGYGNETISLNNHDIGYITMIPNTHFNQSGSGDITFYLYIDNSLYRTITIDYKTINESVMAEPAGINTQTKYFMGWIITIILAGIVGSILGFSSEEEGAKSGKIAVNIFLIGCIIFPVIIGTGYWIALISVFKFGLSYLTKVFNE